VEAVPAGLLNGISTLVRLNVGNARYIGEDALVGTGITEFTMESTAELHSALPASITTVTLTRSQFNDESFFLIRQNMFNGNGYSAITRVVVESETFPVTIEAGAFAGIAPTATVSFTGEAPITLLNPNAFNFEGGVTVQLRGASGAAGNIYGGGSGLRLFRGGTTDQNWDGLKNLELTRTVTIPVL